MNPREFMEWVEKATKEELSEWLERNDPPKSSRPDPGKREKRFSAYPITRTYLLTVSGGLACYMGITEAKPSLIVFGAGMAMVPATLMVVGNEETDDGGPR